MKLDESLNLQCLDTKAKVNRYKLILDVSENSGVFPPNHPFVHKVFPYFHHPFWDTTILGNPHIA